MMFLSISKAFASFAKLVSFTRAALSFGRSPSGVFLNLAQRYSATTKSSTASPKNSSLSLLPFDFVLFCALGLV